uniref:Uncharacterized protein n=1 Tax=Picea sitchensis TaxID=3332 RepID=D5ABG0_PICSI|nr:unknown [Picea sitchensis]
MPGRPGRSGLDNAISEADELKAVILSVQRYLRFLLDNPPTRLDHLYAVKNLVANLVDNIVQECNKVFPNWKLTTKRQPSLIQGSNGLHLPKVRPQFQVDGGGPQEENRQTNRFFCTEAKESGVYI